MIKKLYPNGKAKSFNVTYDDGVLQDICFVEHLNKFNLKGTFNLNSGLIENEFEWVHENGCVVKRLSKDKVISLYQGHEIASHTLTHPYMDNLSESEILYELKSDKANLEELFSREVKGFAVPFDYYSDLIEKCVKQAGFSYARISEESRSFIPQTDYFKWKATVFHTDSNLKELTQHFIKSDQELALFQIVGHSYDLDIENMWDRLESVFIEIAAQKDILPMTTIEIIEYLKAMDQAEITDSYIKNNSNISMWFSVNRNAFELKSFEMLYFKKKQENSMNKKTYHLFENYMLECMGDSAHDKDHIYRVLYNAMDIAETEQNVDYDVLICACLLHDIGRKEQFENPKLCHAMVGGEKVYCFLLENHFSKDFADKVKHCIQAHRFRQSNPPQSLEAKILFDADKIDATGALGVARTLFYKGTVGESLYSLLPDGRVSDGTDDEKPSFFQEYKYKLEKLYDRFYTKRGNEIARERQKTAVAFYNDMLKEVSNSYDRGLDLLDKQLSDTELWDAYDKDFKIIEGVTLKRGEKITDGIFHLVCDIIVRHTDGDYLIMQRDARKHYGGMWEATAGGSALMGESPLQCAVRELFEETGIQTETLTEVGRVVDEKYHSAYVEYLCVTDCDKSSVKLQDGETSDFRWVDKDTLLNMKKDELITERMELFIEELTS